jgi:hypothetical protein
VILLEIDAGAKPQPESTGPFQAVSVPMNAMNNSAYLNSDLNKQFYIHEIRRILCQPPGHPNNCPTILHFRFECNHYDPLHDKRMNDVMTAWTLGPQDKANVISRFLLELDRWRNEYRGMNNDMQRSMTILNESQTLIQSQNQLFQESQSLVSELTSRFRNPDQKTDAEFQRLSGEYQILEKKYIDYEKRVDHYVKDKNDPVMMIANVTEQQKSIHRNLVEVQDLLIAKNKVIQMATLKSVESKPPIEMKTMSFNPQKKLDSRSMESHQNLGKPKTSDSPAKK